MDPLQLKKSISDHTVALEAIAAPIKALWPKTTKVLFAINKDLGVTNTKALSINNELYDGSGENALGVWSAGIVSNTMSRDSAWITVMSGNPKTKGLPGVSKFFKALEDMFYTMLSHSNFYEWGYEFTYTAGWACTAVGFIEPNYVKKSVNFQLLPTGSYLIAQDSQGTVNTCFRWFYMEAGEILKRWPKLPDDKAQAMRQNLFASYKMRHCVRPRDGYNGEDQGNKNFAFESTYWLDDGMHLLEEGGFRDFPFFAFRVERSDGSPYGDGPGLRFIRDSQISQAVSETLLLVDQKLSDPARDVAASIRDDGYVTHPGGVNYVPDQLVGKASSPVNQGIIRPIGAAREDILRQAVERHFKMPFFLMQSQADRTRTRAESLLMKAEQVTTLAPIFGRFQSEVLDMIWPHLIRFAHEFGLIPDIPESLAGMTFADLDVEYQNSLATIQKSAATMSGMEAFVSGLQQLNMAVQNAPAEVQDAIKVSDAVDLLAEANGVTSILTDTNFRKISAEQRRQAATLMAQAQTQMQAMQAGAPGSAA